MRRYFGNMLHNPDDMLRSPSLNFQYFLGNMELHISNAQKQQRARQQLSCTSCRAGKLKCNRQYPCDQCCRRAREDGCQFLPPPAKKKQSKNTKDRIAQLEGLVVQLMNRVSHLPFPCHVLLWSPIRSNGAIYDKICATLCARHGIHLVCRH